MDCGKKNTFCGLSRNDWRLTKASGIKALPGQQVHGCYSRSIICSSVDLEVCDVASRRGSQLKVKKKRKK